MVNIDLAGAEQIELAHLMKQNDASIGFKPSPASYIQMLAIESLFQSQVIGLGWADASQIVRFKQGELANTLELDEPLCRQFPVLFGMEEDVERLKQATRAKLTIPRVTIVRDRKSTAKTSVEIIWDTKLGGYIVLFHATEPLTEEIRLVRNLRIRRIAEEDAAYWSSRKATEEAIQIFPSQGKPTDMPISKIERDNPMRKLTVREREVVELLIRGSSNKQIAHALSISEKTVEAHRARAIKRLGVKTSAQLIRMAGEHGLH